MNAPDQRRPRKSLVLAWLALIAVELVTQLSLKRAGKATGAFDFSMHAFAVAIGSGWLWLAIASYCSCFVVWMLILLDSDLSRAFPTSAIVFVAVMVTSWLVLHEPIGAIQLLGASVIVAGILQLGHDRPVAPPQIASVVAPSPTITE